MRKLFFAVLTLLSFSITASAQQSPKKEAQAKTEAKVPLKKDGTPDKRYKENKEKVVLKKDGTPDKRYQKKK